MKREYSRDLGGNLIKLYQFIYFQLIFVVHVKLSKIYHKYIHKLPNNDDSSTTLSIRFGSLFFVAVPIAGILGIEKFEDWGGYLLIISYSMFVFSFYTRINLFFELIKYIYSKIRRIKKVTQPKKEDLYSDLISQLYSGSMID